MIKYENRLDRHLRIRITRISHFFLYLVNKVNQAIFFSRTEVWSILLVFITLEVPYAIARKYLRVETLTTITLI